MTEEATGFGNGKLKPSDLLPEGFRVQAYAIRLSEQTPGDYEKLHKEPWYVGQNGSKIGPGQNTDPWDYPATKATEEFRQLLAAQGLLVSGLHLPEMQVLGNGIPIDPPDGWGHWGRPFFYFGAVFPASVSEDEAHELLSAVAELRRFHRVAITSDGCLKIHSQHQILLEPYQWNVDHSGSGLETVAELIWRAVQGWEFKSHFPEVKNIRHVLFLPACLGIHRGNQNVQWGEVQLSAMDLLLTGEKLSEFKQKWHAAGCDIAHYEKMWAKKSDTPRPAFLVPGIIPCETVTLLVGSEAIGKSTLVSHLAAQVSTAATGKNATFLRIPVTLPDTPDAHHSVVVFSAEETASVYNQRLRDLGADVDSLPLMFFGTYSGINSAKAIVAELEGLQPALIIIDPLRSYLEGDEDNSTSVSELFDVLFGFAARCGCAVVIVHHLKKNEDPKTLKLLHNAIRGSAVLTNRPRMVLGLISPRAGVRVFGITKHNFSECDVSTAEVQIELEKGRLVAASGNQSPGNKKTVHQKGHNPLLEAIIGLIVNGERVTRTGTNSLYVRRHPVVSGMKRKDVEEAVNKLINDREVSLEKNGSLVVGGRGVKA